MSGHLERVGAAIRAARKRAGLTQVQLAAAAGVTQPTISGIEAGRQDATVAGLGRIAEAFGVPAGELLAEETTAATSHQASGTGQKTKAAAISHQAPGTGQKTTTAATRHEAPAIRNKPAVRNQAVGTTAARKAQAAKRRNRP
jgi:transcriptional regulator with XRE-family HTH domain